MSKKKYRVTLTEQEREQLRAMVSNGKAAARKLNHARILLFSDQSPEGMVWTDQKIHESLGVGVRTIERVRQRFVEEGFDDALNPRPRPRGSYKLKEDAESQIVEIAKSDPPQGRKRWTLRLIAERLVTLDCDGFCHETVRKVLKKTP
jgi:transposase